MKKVIEYQHGFIIEFRVRQEVNDGIQTSISYINDEVKNYIEDNMLGKRKKEKIFWLHGDGPIELLTMNPM